MFGFKCKFMKYFNLSFIMAGVNSLDVDIFRGLGFFIMVEVGNFLKRNIFNGY